MSAPRAVLLQEITLAQKGLRESYNYSHEYTDLTAKILAHVEHMEQNAPHIVTGNATGPNAVADASDADSAPWLHIALLTDDERRFLRDSTIKLPSLVPSAPTPMLTTLGANASVVNSSVNLDINPTTAALPNVEPENTLAGKQPRAVLLQQAVDAARAMRALPNFPHEFTDMGTELIADLQQDAHHFSLENVEEGVGSGGQTPAHSSGTSEAVVVDCSTGTPLELAIGTEAQAVGPRI